MTTRTPYLRWPALRTAGQPQMRRGRPRSQMSHAPYISRMVPVTGTRCWRQATITGLLVVSWMVAAVAKAPATNSVPSSSIVPSIQNCRLSARLGGRACCQSWAMYRRLERWPSWHVKRHHKATVAGHARPMHADAPALQVGCSGWPPGPTPDRLDRGRGHPCWRRVPASLIAFGLRCAWRVAFPRRPPLPANVCTPW